MHINSLNPQNNPIRSVQLLNTPFLILCPQAQTGWLTFPRLRTYLAPEQGVKPQGLSEGSYPLIYSTNCLSAPGIGLKHLCPFFKCIRVQQRAYLLIHICTINVSEWRWNCFFWNHEADSWWISWADGVEHPQKIGIHARNPFHLK